jgi:hypothetical protein
LKSKASASALETKKKTQGVYSKLSNMKESKYAKEQPDLDKTKPNQIKNEDKTRDGRGGTA